VRTLISSSLLYTRPNDKVKEGYRLAPWAFSYDIFDNSNNAWRDFNTLYELVNACKNQNAALCILKGFGQKLFPIKLLESSEDASDWKKNLLSKILEARKLNTTGLFSLAIPFITDTFAAIKEERENFSPTEYRSMIYIDYTKFSLTDYTLRHPFGYYDPLNSIYDVISFLVRIYSNFEAKTSIYKYDELMFQGLSIVKGRLSSQNVWHTIMTHCRNCPNTLVVGLDVRCARCSGLQCSVCNSCLCGYKRD